MKTDDYRVPTEFMPETRFEISPSPPAPFRAREEDALEGLKRRLLDEVLERAWDPECNSRLRRAANEAAALARLTPYPALVFPVLFEERANAAVAPGPTACEAQAPGCGRHVLAA